MVLPSKSAPPKNQDRFRKLQIHLEICERCSEVASGWLVGWKRFYQQNKDTRIHDFVKTIPILHQKSGLFGENKSISLQKELVI